MRPRLAWPARAGCHAIGATRDGAGANCPAGNPNKPKEARVVNSLAVRHWRRWAGWAKAPSSPAYRRVRARARRASTRGSDPEPGLDPGAAGIAQPLHALGRTGGACRSAEYRLLGARSAGRRSPRGGELDPLAEGCRDIGAALLRVRISPGMARPLSERDQWEPVDDRSMASCRGKRGPGAAAEQDAQAGCRGSARAPS
jgi:hypothetical protein